MANIYAGFLIVILVFIAYWIIKKPSSHEHFTEELVTHTPSDDNRIFPVIMYTDRYIAKYFVNVLIDATIRFKERIRTQQYTDTTDMVIKTWRAPPKIAATFNPDAPVVRVSTVNDKHKNIINKVRIGINREFNTTPFPIMFSKYVQSNTFKAVFDPMAPTEKTDFTTYFFKIRKHPHFAIHKFYHAIEPANNRMYIMYVTIGRMPDSPTNTKVTIPVDIGILGSDTVHDSNDGECIRKDAKGSLNLTYKRECWALGGEWIPNAWK